MTILLKRVVTIFLFGLLVGLSLNNNSNSEFNSNENSITLVNSLRAGGKSDSNQNTAFVQTPPAPDERYSGEQSTKQPTNGQDLREMPPRFGYRTALLGGKKLPDNPGGGGSWDANNQDNENEFAWKNVQKDPEVWSNYQEYCQHQSKKINHVI